MNAAIQAAEQISAIVPVKPKTQLVGTTANAEEYRAAFQIYGALHAAEMAAWKYAAVIALNNAEGDLSAKLAQTAPTEWFIDRTEALALIEGETSPDILRGMCERIYGWPIRRFDQA